MPLRALFTCAVGSLAVWLLAVSWLRWVDPVIDFGREVYLPWRILQGEHLGRDFVHPYGPLSVYLNAGLMGIFGVSVRTLVIANLAVFGGVVFCLYRVLRRSFGFLPAAVASLVGVAVFGFAHYWGINNYTYAAPYSHEATHGMLLLLLLLLWLGRPRSMHYSLRDGFIAGALTGFCWLTKTEYVAGSLLLITITLLRLASDRTLRPRLGRWAGGCTVGLGLTLGLAAVLLATVMPVATSVRLALNALLAPLAYGEYSRSAHVLRFLGADNLWANVQTVIIRGGGTLGCLAAITAAGRYASARPSRWAKVLFIGIVLAGVLAAIPRIPWLFCGTAFPVLLAAAAGIMVIQVRAAQRPRGSFPCRQWNQLLFLTAAVGLLARMAFDPTISHYGFFQALLAGTWLCGYLVGEWPRLATSSPLVRGGLIVAVLVLLGGGSVSLVNISQRFYRAKGTAIGEGGDRVWGFAPQIYALPEYWELARRYVVAHSPPGSSLLVVPEGLSLNYWTRRRHPLRITDLLPATLRLNRGDVVAELAAHPPKSVVLVSRPNMTELGYATYGQDASSGQAILEWVSRHYTLVAEVGSKPFAPGGVGLQIYDLRQP